MQPTTPTQAAANGATAQQITQPTAKQQVKEVDFSTIKQQYVSQLNADGSPTDASNDYLLSLTQRQAAELYEKNLELYSVKEGESRYSRTCKALGGFWDISLTYCPQMKALCIHLWTGAIMAVELPIILESDMIKKDTFVSWFCSYGWTETKGNLNPVLSYFHTLLTFDL